MQESLVVSLFFFSFFLSIRTTYLQKTGFVWNPCLHGGKKKENALTMHIHMLIMLVVSQTEQKGIMGMYESKKTQLFEMVHSHNHIIA